jgi:hypothetical protein
MAQLSLKMVHSRKLGIRSKMEGSTAIQPRQLTEMSGKKFLPSAALY